MKTLLKLSKVTRPALLKQWKPFRTGESISSEKNYYTKKNRVDGHLLHDAVFAYIDSNLCNPKKLQGSNLVTLVKNDEFSNSFK